MLADRIGRRPTILLSLLGAAAAAGALAFLSSPLSVGLVVLLFGLTSQAVNAPFQAIVTDLVSRRMRPRAFGLAYWARNLGVSLSLLTGGFLASRGWALPFLADAITTLAFAFVVLRRVPETRPSGHAAESTGPGHREVLADRAFAGFLALHFLFSMAFWQLHAGLPIDMARHGVSPAAFGSVLAVNTILVALLQPFAHRLTGRLAPARTLAAGSLLVGLGYGGYALCSTAPQYALATGILTLGEIVYQPVAGVVVADLAPPQSRGRYAGAFGLSFGLAGFLAPIAGPALMQARGAPALWMACLLACAGVAAGQLALGRARRGAIPEQGPARPA